MANKRSFLDKAKSIHPDLPTVLTPMFSRLETLESQADSIGTVSKPLTTDLQGGNNKLTGVADPTDAQDVVNLQTLQKYVAAALKQKGL